jgi:hypothetical protein
MAPVHKVAKADKPHKTTHKAEADPEVRRTQEELSKPSAAKASNKTQYKTSKATNS